MGMSERGWNLVWLVVVATLSSWASLASSRDLGVTFDEPIYLERGLQRWREGTLSPLIRLGTMPLPVDVQTAPVYFWERLQGERFDPRADLPRILPVARAMNLLFWWLLLGYTFVFAAHLGGAWAARLAVVLVACEPSLLGHAGLATTDLSVTACLVALAYHFWVGRESGWWGRVGLPALWFGLAALCKASGPVFGILLLGTLEVFRRFSGGGRTAFLRDAMQIVLLGTLLLFAYCRSDWQPQADALRWAEKLPEGSRRDTAVQLISSVRVFPNAADGFFRQVGHNARGHGAYLLGVTSPSALWWYFPVLLTIKLSLPVIVLLALLLLFAPRQLLNPAMACVLVLFAFSVFCRVQIGIRFMFPLLTFLLIALSTALVRWAAEASTSGRSPVFAPGLGVLTATWALLVAGSAWPNGLSFVNELYAKARPGYHWVSESNFDWGHGAPGLRQWADDHRTGKLAVWYYGADPALEGEPFELVRLHEGDIDANLQQLRGRYLAVSTTLVHGPPLSPLVVEARKRLQTKEPIARIRTFLIYEMRE
jgi:hypothetical protein